MAKTDYYELLGISKDADADEIKKAFRKNAMKYHPDKNPGDPSAEKKFKEMNEAYSVLSDADKKAAYDRYGHAAFEGGQGGAGQQGFEFNSSSFSSIFEDLFSDMTGRGRSGRANQRGSDLRYDMTISLEEAYNGKKTQIKIPSAIICSGCNGSGAEGISKPETCTACGGHGKVRATQGFFMVERTCVSCQGSGKIIKNPCRSCNGKGRIKKDKTLSVTIPPGVEDGNRIRLNGEGEIGTQPGGAGDLYIFLSIKPHGLFRRDGDRLFCRIPIPMTTATLGGSIDVPTMDGNSTRMNIPHGTQTGKQFRLKGKGMPKMRSSSFGDLYIDVVVETPVNLSAKQKELLQEFAQTDGGGTNSPESTGFFARVKELWNELKE